MGRSKARKSKSGNKAAEDGLSQENKTSLPYKVEESPLYGRYLAAAQDLSPGCLILEELPLVVAPSEDTSPVCIGCYSALQFNQAHRCEKCRFPLCSINCSGIGKKSGHSDAECQLLKKSKIGSISTTTLSNNLQAIGPLRCLAIKQFSPADWGIIAGMETHTNERRKSNTLWQTNQQKVVEVIRQQWGLVDFGEDLIHEMCGVLEVNAFEVGGSLRAIFPSAYLFAHRCIPNTRHCDGEDFKTTFRALTKISKGDPIYVTYTYILQGTQKRRHHLKESKFFDCECSRCRDPTECGTNMSALICSKCHNILNSSQPLDPTASWKCNQKNCTNSIPADSVLKLTDKIFNELDSIGGNDIPAYEALLTKYSNTLHENHYLMLSALHCLYEKYGKIDGYLINNLSEEQLDRKIEICRILISVFNKVETGFSKQKGLILYELHAPLMVKLQKNFHEKKIGKIAIKSSIREVVKCLEESIKLLEVEPAGGEAAAIANAAAQALENLESWREMIIRM